MSIDVIFTESSPHEHAANKEQPGGVWGALGKDDVYAEYLRCVEDAEQKACGRSCTLMAQIKIQVKIQHDVLHEQM